MTTRHGAIGVVTGVVICSVLAVACGRSSRTASVTVAPATIPVVTLEPLTPDATGPRLVLQNGPPIIDLVVVDGLTDDDLLYRVAGFRQRHPEVRTSFSLTREFGRSVTVHTTDVVTPDDVRHLADLFSAEPWVTGAEPHHAGQ